MGRMLVGQVPSETRLIDIALLEEHRNRGIGAELLRQLLQKCETKSRPARLRVLQGNPAIRLYRRMGFLQSSTDPMYAQMEWIPSQPPKEL